MGEALVIRRGGTGSGQYAYEVKQYIVNESAVSSGIASCKTVIYGDSYSVDPATGLMTIPNGIRMDVTAGNKDLLVGKYITGPHPAEPYCLSDTQGFYVTSITAPSGTYYSVTIAGTVIQSSKQRVKIVLQNSNQYPTDTVVGNEIRKNL